MLSDHVATAEQTVLKFKSIYTDKVRVLHPGSFPPLPPLPPGFPAMPQQLLHSLQPPGIAEQPNKPINYVAKGFLFAGQGEGEQEGVIQGPHYVEIVDLYEDLIAINTQGVFFDPDVYPAVVWLEHGKTREAPPIRTIVFPSGVVIVHGTDSIETLVELYQRKLPYLTKFLR